MASKSKYFTRARANTGVILKIKTPEGGDAGDWLRVRGRDSDEYHREKTESDRRLVATSALERPADRVAAGIEEDLKTTAILVSEWSFEEPCTFDAVVEFLRESPQIKTSIDMLAFNRDRFFGAESSFLLDMQKRASDLASQPKPEGNPSEQT
jgi:hypothetical protein